MAVTTLDAIHSLDDRAGGVWQGYGYGGAGGSKNQALTLADFYDYYLIQKIRLYMPWFIIGFGLTGNLLILAIFLKKSRRCTSNGICFSALAIADSLALIFMLMRALLKLHIVSNMALTCKLIKFIYHVSLQLSSWCLVLLTIDRLIAVLFVFKYITWCKRFYALRGLGLIFVLVVVANIHLVIFRDARPQSNVERYAYNYNFHNYIRHRPSPQSSSQMNTLIQINERPQYTCYVDPVKHSFYFVHIYNAWDIYHCVIYGAAPFLVILISNVTIIYKLSTAHKNKSISKTRMTTMGEEPAPPAPPQVSVQTARPGRKTRDPTIKSIQITIMLLAIAFLFLILTSPISIYMAVFYQRLPHLRDSRRELIKVILRYIGYVNNAANFYIYMIFSSEFRREFVGLFKGLLRCRCFRGVFRKCQSAARSSDSRQPTTSTRLASDSERRVLSTSNQDETTNETLTRTLLSTSKQTPRSGQHKNDVSNIYTDHRVLTKGQQRSRNQQDQLNESLTPFIQHRNNSTT